DPLAEVQQLLAHGVCLATSAFARSPSRHSALSPPLSSTLLHSPGPPSPSRERAKSANVVASYLIAQFRLHPVRQANQPVRAAELTSDGQRWSRGRRSRPLRATYQWCPCDI